MIDIEVLYFDGCPNHPPALTRLDEVLAELKVEAQVVQRAIESQEEAEAAQFLGSPSIRVNGLDVEPEARERTAYAYSCRTYNGDGVPAKALIADAIREGLEAQ